MRHAGKFNPEWGYLAPAPNFLRTARVFLVAAAIGSTASAGVVFSMMDQPAAERSIAARTLVQFVDPTATAPSTLVAAQLQTQSEHALLEAQHVSAPSAMRPQGAAAGAHAGAGSTDARELDGASTAQHAPIAASLAEAPRIIATEAPHGSADENTPKSPAQEAAPAAAAGPTPAPRAVAKKPRAVARAAAPPRHDLPRYAPRYEPRYGSMERAFLRQYGSYGQAY